MESNIRQLMTHKLDTTRIGKFSDVFDRMNSELLEPLFYNTYQLKNQLKKLY
jgi:hypothetical protein